MQATPLESGTHAPIPLQMAPPWSLQVVPSTAKLSPQAFPVHVELAQLVPVLPQSEGITHCTQEPVPLQT